MLEQSSEIHYFRLVNMAENVVETVNTPKYPLETQHQGRRIGAICQMLRGGAATHGIDDLVGTVDISGCIVFSVSSLA